MRRRSRLTSPRSAVATVELAIVLPFILIPFFVMLIQFGRLVEAQQVVVNAAREGGRQVSTGTKSVSEVETSVLNYLNRMGVPTNTVPAPTVTVTPLNGAPADPRNADQLEAYRVTVTVPFVGTGASRISWTDIAFQQTFFSNIMISSQCDWYSMKDIPITVSTQVPVPN